MRKPTWRSYITIEAVSTASKIELINNKEFAGVVLDEDSKTFVVHVVTLEVMSIYSFKTFQIQDRTILVVLQ